MLNTELIMQKSNDVAEYELYRLRLGNCQRFLISACGKEQTQFELVGESAEGAEHLLLQIAECGLYPEHLADVAHDFCESVKEQI